MDLPESKKKMKITLEDIQSLNWDMDYQTLASQIQEQIAEEVLSPIPNSKDNGKYPPLYNRYWLWPKPKEYPVEWLQELDFEINPSLHTDYYRKNLKAYEKDRNFILDFSHYLDKHREWLKEPISYNERSFEIWSREKYLLTKGIPLLKNLGFSHDELNVYETTEPVSHYFRQLETPMTILIIENKDTFYSMRRHLKSGKDTILNISVGALLYGGGKRASKAFIDFVACAEPELKDINNNYLYFGDIDYEGFRIYETLCKAAEEYSIKPFTQGYIRMLYKSKDRFLPTTKTGQKEMEYSLFLNYFSKEIQRKMSALLKERKYIPQECLNAKDF